MLRWAFSLLLLTLLAALFGFGGLTTASVAIARALFYVFFGVFLLAFVAGLVNVGRATE